MTIDEWNSIRAGDVLIDKHFRDAERKVFKIKRVKSKNSALTRSCLTVTNLKSPGGYSIFFETENTGPHRFDLKPRSPSCPSSATSATSSTVARGRITFRPKRISF